MKGGPRTPPGSSCYCSALECCSTLVSICVARWRDTRSPRWLTMAAILLTGVITVFFLLFDGGMPSFAVVIAWGTAAGGLNIPGSMMLAQYFGRTSFGAISGLMEPFRIGALGLGPTFGAILLSRTGGYTTLWIFSVAAYMIALVLIYAVRPPRLPGAAVAESNS